MSKNELVGVELAMSKIDEILNKSRDAEAYEDCAKLRDAKLAFEEYLDGKKEDKEIKDELYFVNQKIGDLIRDELKSRNKS